MLNDSLANGHWQAIYPIKRARMDAVRVVRQGLVLCIFPGVNPPAI